MKETCKLTQVATDEIIKGVADFNSYMVTKLYEVVKNSLEERNIIKSIQRNWYISPFA